MSRESVPLINTDSDPAPGPDPFSIEGRKMLIN